LRTQAGGKAISSTLQLRLLVVALAVGTIVMTVEAYLDGYLDYLLSDFGAEWAPMVVRVLLVSAPFLVLARRGATNLMPWTVGIILTALVWGCVIYESRSGAFEGGTSVGNSMWLAMVSVGSSIGIAVICALLSRRRAS
jgi:hypothetical protein